MYDVSFILRWILLLLLGNWPRAVRSQVELICKWAWILERAVLTLGVSLRLHRSLFLNGIECIHFSQYVLSSPNQGHGSSKTLA